MKIITENNFHFMYISAYPLSVDETTSLLNSLMASHGANYLEKVFGRKARNRLAQLGGVNKVAIAVSGT